MWAYPNFIPLSPAVLKTMWERLEPYEFNAVHSLFIGRDVRDPRIKGEVLDDMKRQARFEGYGDDDHPIFQLKWDDSHVTSLPVMPASTSKVKPPAHSQLERGF